MVFNRTFCGATSVEAPRDLSRYKKMALKHYRPLTGWRPLSRAQYWTASTHLPFLNSYHCCIQNVPNWQPARLLLCTQGCTWHNLLLTWQGTPSPRQLTLPCTISPLHLTLYHVHNTVHHTLNFARCTLHLTLRWRPSKPTLQDNGHHVHDGVQWNADVPVWLQLKEFSVPLKS